MALLKRAGSRNWLIQFTYLGETVRRSSGTPSKPKARDLEAEWRRQIHERAKAGKAPSITLGDAIDRYYQTVLAPKGKPATLKSALYSLNQIRTHFGPDRKLDQITQTEVATWRDRLLTEKGLSAAGANRLYATVRAIFNAALNEWAIAAPGFKLKMLKEPSGRVRHLTDEEEDRLLAACASYLRDIVTFMMDSGARRGETHGLRWTDVRFTGDRAVVVFRATETKDGEFRQVPLPARTTEVLKRLHSARDENTHVFMTPVRSQGGKLKAGANNRTAFQAACRRAGIEDFTLHDLRHHYASRLAQRGASLQQIKELLGHASITMTMRYAHLVRSDLDRAVSLLDPPPTPAPSVPPVSVIPEPARVRQQRGWFSIGRAINAIRGKSAES